MLFTGCANDDSEAVAVDVTGCAIATSVRRWEETVVTVKEKTLIGFLHQLTQT